MSSKVQTIKILGAKLHNDLRSYSEKNGTTLSDMSVIAGHSSTYINCLKGYTAMKEPQFLLVCRLFDLNPNDYLVPDPKPEPKKEPEKPSFHVASGYDMVIKVQPHSVYLAIFFDSSEITHAYSTIREGSELGLFQAISYAAHMLYKNVEQKKLEEKDNG